MNNFIVTNLFSLIIHGLCYVLIILPPYEFLLAGLYPENLLSSILGDEKINFVQFHLKKTLFYKILFLFVPTELIYSFLTFNSTFINDLIGLRISSISISFLWIPFISYCYYVYVHLYTAGSWSGHPLIAQLKQLANLTGSNDWQSISGQIHSEFLSPDKHIVNSSTRNSYPGKRIIVTKSYILYSNKTEFCILPQSLNEYIAVVSSATLLTNFDNSIADGNGLRTWLTIRFISLETQKCLLSFTMPSSELEDLRPRLVCTLTVANDVKIEPTIVESFTEIFQKSINENRPISSLRLEQSDSCIGCTQSSVDVAIVKRCIQDSNSRFYSCGSCLCRPMWCSACLAKWIVHRHTNGNVAKHEWLETRVPCPTCRTPFCIDDVARIGVQQSKIPRAVDDFDIDRHSSSTVSGSGRILKNDHQIYRSVSSMIESGLEGDRQNLKRERLFSTESMMSLRGSLIANRSDSDNGILVVNSGQESSYSLRRMSLDRLSSSNPRSLNKSTSLTQFKNPTKFGRINSVIDLDELEKLLQEIDVDGLREWHRLRIIPTFEPIIPNQNSKSPKSTGISQKSTSQIPILDHKSILHIMARIDNHNDNMFQTVKNKQMNIWETQSMIESKISNQWFHQLDEDLQITNSSQLKNTIDALMVTLKTFEIQAIQLNEALDKIDNILIEPNAK